MEKEIKHPWLFGLLIGNLVGSTWSLITSFNLGRLLAVLLFGYGLISLTLIIMLWKERK